METINLSTVVGLTGAIVAAFIFGAVVTLVFWRQDRTGLIKSRAMQRLMVFLGLPLLFAGISCFGPNAEKLEPVFGRFFPFYASIGIAFLTYLIPAAIAGIIILLKRTNQKRWLYASFVFCAAAGIAMWRLVVIFVYAKGNPHITW